MLANSTNLTAVRGDPTPHDHGASLGESATTPWTTAELDPDKVLADLRRRFPSHVCWRGEYTGLYWAVSLDRHDRDRLWSSADPHDLARQISTPRLVKAPTASSVGASAEPLPPCPCPDHSPAPGRHRRARRDGWFARLLRPFFPPHRRPPFSAAPTPHGRA